MYIEHKSGIEPPTCNIHMTEEIPPMRALCLNMHISSLCIYMHMSLPSQDPNPNRRYRHRNVSIDFAPAWYKIRRTNVAQNPPHQRSTKSAASAWHKIRTEEMGFFEPTAMRMLTGRGRKKLPIKISASCRTLL